MSLLQIASTLIVLAGAFGAINYLVLKLPSAIGILIVALLASVIMMGLDLIVPSLGIADTIRAQVVGIEFSDALLEGMLGLLLFAGALHVKTSDLKREWPTVTLMATMGIAISTAVVGYGFAYVTGMPLLVALVFGALISPTDPVAVMGVLRETNLPKSLETKIAGESLFNDGVGYVVYLILVGAAFTGAAHGDSDTSVASATALFAQEAMRHIDDYSLEVLLTLGLAFGGYELAVALHVSAPIMAVCAGLLIGDVGTRLGMSEETRKYVEAFWKLIDEILNAVLFLMIGVEVFAIVFDTANVMAGLAAIVLGLFARFLAVAVPITLLRPFRDYSTGVIRIMTWGGLKGGISVALALSLPDGEWKPVILTATYMVVVFSIIVQGLTVARLARHVNPQPELLP
jgi:CPA1 family monovalent cation:H+ antiporter